VFDHGEFPRVTSHDLISPRRSGITGTDLLRNCRLKQADPQ